MSSEVTRMKSSNMLGQIFVETIREGSPVNFLPDQGQLSPDLFL